MLTPEIIADWRHIAAGPAHGVNINSRLLTALLDAADELEQLRRGLRGVQERAWRDGYYTGKRDYAGSITGGAPISTPNPYRVLNGADEE